MSESGSRRAAALRLGRLRLMLIELNTVREHRGGLAGNELTLAGHREGPCGEDYRKIRVNIGG